ncbi:hypothetical protein RRG08_043309 [Elysia crispata]|uniref:Uncharacterized protein n=1 Tax=Elysia crispata TaxID=231223 RepID=A0AAE0XXJ4_9GAST|nr:hypothetical protein RRG08_043309 [Elysia crispata]
MKNSRRYTHQEKRYELNTSVANVQGIKVKRGTSGNVYNFRPKDVQGRTTDGAGRGVLFRFDFYLPVCSWDRMLLSCISEIIRADRGEERATQDLGLPLNQHSRERNRSRSTSRALLSTVKDGMEKGEKIQRRTA